MQLRKHSRPRSLAGALLLAAAVSTSCGFNLATDRDYTPANGANERGGVIDVLAATVVSAEEGTGVFIASLSNNSQTETFQLEGLTSNDQEELAAGNVTPIEIAPAALVNLALTETPIEVTGAFEAGDYVQVNLSFSNGETANMDVPVVLNCGIYNDVAGLPAGPDECAVAEPVEHGE